MFLLLRLFLTCAKKYLFSGDEERKKKPEVHALCYDLGLGFEHGLCHRSNADYRPARIISASTGTHHLCRRPRKSPRAAHTGQTICFAD